MNDIKINKPKKLRKVSTRLFLIIGMLFLAAAVITVVLVNTMMRQAALSEAKTKAQIILDRNLATHMYFSHQLKPKLFELTDPIIPDDYFEPSWMSSTYAVRKIDKYFRSLFEADYYYKECAINARSPENEADAYEKAFLEEINADAEETMRSDVRVLDDKPFLEVLRPGETLEQTCMRCHSSPEEAPGDLVRYYGPERSFNRKAGEIVSAISIRIPLSAAYASVNQFSIQLSLFLTGVLFSLFVLLYFVNNLIIFKPLSLIHKKAVRLSTNTELLGEEIPLPAGRELNQLTAVFNSMSKSLKNHMDNLETLISQRTSQLSDANQQLRLEMAARSEEEERFRLLTELAPVGIYQTDLKGDCVYVNSTWCKMAGLSPDEALGDGWVNGLHPEDLKTVKTKWYAAAHSEGEWGLEYRFQTFDGKVTWVYGLARSLRDKNGSITGYMGLNVDITENKAAKKILEENESRYRQTFETNQATKLIIDPEDGRIVDANNAACRFYGYSKNEILARNISEINILPPEEINQEMVQAAAEKRLFFNFRHRLASGEIRDVEVYSGPVILRDKTVLYSIIHDITNRKTTEKEKAQLETQLRQSRKMESIGTLAGGIAHDFNNILASVLGYTELSLDDVEDGTQMADNLQEIYIAGKRARDLVKQILTFARQTDEAVKPVRVSTIAKEVMQFIRATIPTSIELRQKTDTDSLIMGNPTQVHQIFMNLCTNAAHAMRDSGGILELNLEDIHFDSNASQTDLALVESGAYLKISISDTGSGIPPDIIESVFDPYFTTKELGDGTGMGLAMVHGIVKDYGGDITVVSRIDHGSLFTVYLPVVKQQPHTAKPQTEEPLYGTERILFVDDEAPIAKMGRQILERLGYSVTTRTSSIEALALFTATPYQFDLVITDMTMPHMTGDRLAAELIKVRPDIPVILCTGYSKKMSEQAAAAVGIKAFAYKPIGKNNFLKIVRKVLDDSKTSLQ